LPRCRTDRQSTDFISATAKPTRKGRLSLDFSPEKEYTERNLTNKADQPMETAMTTALVRRPIPLVSDCIVITAGTMEGRIAVAIEKARGEILTTFPERKCHRLAHLSLPEQAPLDWDVLCRADLLDFLETFQIFFLWTISNMFAAKFIWETDTGTPVEHRYGNAYETIATVRSVFPWFLESIDATRKTRRARGPGEKNGMRNIVSLTCHLNCFMDRDLQRVLDRASRKES
jgi:hypothetical protein